MDAFRGFEHCVRENEPLAPYTWIRLGGVAEFFAEPTSDDELIELVKRCREQDIPARLLGGGSNVLIRDEGVAGLVIHLSAPAFSQIDHQDQTIRARGGAKLGHVISVAVREGLAGLESLVGIPGTVGGALHGNAGAHGVDIGQSIHSASVLDRNGNVTTHTREEMRFAYRSSSVDELVILETTFALEQGNPAELTSRMQKLWIVRKSQQPPSEQNVCRALKDSAGASAASLIEQAGLRGARIGEAEISDREPNFIVAHPGATADDVRRLIELMRSQVHERTGVELEPELEIW